MTELAKTEMARRLEAAPLAVLRLLSLAGRFVITLYIMRFIGVEAVGIYGYIVGGYTIMTAVGGLGMNYTMDRDVVHGSLFVAALVVRDRMFIRTLVAVPVVILGYLLLPLPIEISHSSLPGLIVLGETLLFDVQRTIAYRGYQLAANAFLFVRSAAWVPFVVILGAIWPSFRTLDAVLAGWALSLLLSFASLLYLYTITPIRRGRCMPVDWRWVRESLHVGRLAYVADIGSVSIGYFDRYFIGAFLGLEAAGTYVFFWSFTNAIVSLIQASQFQVIFPQLVSLRRMGEHAKWRRTLRRGLTDVLLMTTALALAMFAAMAASIATFAIQGSKRNLLLFALMLIGTLIKLMSDMLHDGLHSARRDRRCLIIYTLGSVISPPLTVLLVVTMGPIGAGVQMIVTNGIMLVMRGLAVLRLSTDEGRQPIFRTEGYT